MLSTHYRSPLDFTKDAIIQSRNALDRLYGALRSVHDIDVDQMPAVPSEVIDALSDDLNTPLAISKLHALAGELNKTDDDKQKRLLKGQLLAAGDLLGILQQDATAWCQWSPVSRGRLDEAAIDALITERQEAKASKNFARADAIRDELKGQGVMLEDGPEGTSWRRAG